MSLQYHTTQWWSNRQVAFTPEIQGRLEKHINVYLSKVELRSFQGLDGRRRKSFLEEIYRCSDTEQQNKGYPIGPGAGPISTYIRHFYSNIHQEIDEIGKYILSDSFSILNGENDFLDRIAVNVIAENL